MPEQKILIIHPADTVAVALQDVPEGTKLELQNGQSLVAKDRIPRAHKIALQDIPNGADVIKYGYPLHSQLLLNRSEEQLTM